MFRLLVEPHDEPNKVRCCVKPTTLFNGGARNAKGPSRVVVENDRAAGEKAEKDRVSGETWRREYCLGIAASIDAVVGVEDVVYRCRKADRGTEAM